jgi:hypothetical protein
MGNLFHIDMMNFTLVEFDDEDEDGYKRYDLYFTSLGEFLGLPIYSDLFVLKVQADILENGIEFLQACLDNRWGDSGKNYTVSGLWAGGDQSVAALEGESRGEEDDDNDGGKLRTRLIIGLTAAAVVVAFCGIIFAYRLLGRAGDDAAPASEWQRLK